MLSRGAIRGYHGMLDLESLCFVAELEAASGAGEFSIKPFAQRYALSTSLTLCYGVRMGSAHDEMVREILEVGSAISLLRSASENYQDYIPLLRWFPNEKTRRSRDLRVRRDRYLDQLMSRARERIARGINVPCVSDAVLMGEEGDLTKEEVASVCLSLISGGFESVPLTLMMSIAALATPDGRRMQEEAYHDIMRYYLSAEEAWAASFQQDTVPYINAIIKETLRFYTVTAVIQPRMTVSDVDWDGAVIPKGTMILVNAQAANHDEQHFGPTAHAFDPSRWLKPETAVPEELPATGLPHLAFGAGSRNCVGAALGHRLLYTALVRLISCFRFQASEKDPPTTDAVEFNAAKSAMVAHAKDFKIGLIKRQGVDVAAVLKLAQDRTSHDG